MPEINLRQLTVVAQPWFTYRACGPFTKNKERIHKFQETGDSRYAYHKKVDKACIPCDMWQCLWRFYRLTYKNSFW